MLPTAIGTITNFDTQKAWMANIVWTIGNNQLIYQHQDMKDGGWNARAIVGGPGVAVGPNPHCKVDTIAWQYNFSRRTFAHVLYDRVDNNDTASCNFGAVSLPIVAGQDPRGVSVGLRHIF